MASIDSGAYVNRCKKVVRTVYGNSNCFKLKSWYAPKFSIE